MAFFKSKQEREIIARMEREEQSELFNEQINELKKSVRNTQGWQPKPNKRG